MLRFLFIAILLLASNVRAEVITGERREAFQQNLKELEEKARATLFPLKMRDGALILDFDVLKAVTEVDVKAHRMPMLQPGAVGHWSKWAGYLYNLVHGRRQLGGEQWTGYGVDVWVDTRIECDVRELYFRREDKISHGPKKKDHLLILAEGKQGLRVRVLKAGVGADLKQEDGKATLTFYLEDGKEKKIVAATAAECFAKDAELAERYFFGMLAGIDLKVSGR